MNPFDSTNVPPNPVSPSPEALWANVRLVGLVLMCVGCGLIGLFGLLSTATVMYEDKILTASGRVAWVSLFAGSAIAVVGAIVFAIGRIAGLGRKE
jgi:hypothetical protein